jgi:hypothetical protein
MPNPTRSLRRRCSQICGRPIVGLLGVLIWTHALAQQSKETKPAVASTLPNWQPAPAQGGAIPGCDDAAYLAARKRTAELYQEGLKTGNLADAGKQALGHYQKCGAVLTNPQRAWLLNDYALVQLRSPSYDCWTPLRKATEFAAGDAKAAKAVAFNRRKCAERIQQRDTHTLDDVALLNSLLRPGKENLPPPLVCAKPGVEIVTLRHGVDPNGDAHAPPPVEYVLGNGTSKLPCGDACEAQSGGNSTNRIRRIADLNGDGLVELEIHTALFIGNWQGQRFDQNDYDLLLACGENRYVVASRSFEEEDENSDLEYGFDSITPLDRHAPSAWPRERVDAKGKKGRQRGQWVQVDAEANTK